MSKMDEVLAAIALSTNANTRARQNCNPNLLHNWYWLNPVNQREATEYTQNGPGIDRWRSWNITDGVISSSGITWSAGALIQKLESSVKSVITGKMLTFSVLLANGAFYSGSQLYTGERYIHPVYNDYVDLQIGNDATPSCGILAFQGITVVAAKVELGSYQTLAHRENGVWLLNEIPDYGEQLLLCQRYYQRFRTQSLRPTYAEDFRPTMRIQPSLGTQTIDGTTYYTASADI